MSRHVRLLGIAALIALVSLLAFRPLALAAPTAETKSVSIKDFQFDPKELTVSVGDTVTWTNSGQSRHTVTADDGSFDSGGLDAGATFSHTFASAGTFAYYCQFHGAKGGVSMAGTIKVEAAMAEPTAEATAAMAAPTAEATAAMAEPTAETTAAMAEPTAEATATMTAPTATAAMAAASDSVEANDQPLANGGIVVKEIYASVDGWIVVHLDESGKPGKVLGFSAVKKGENNNVAVKLSEDVPAGGKVWPMLHIDAGTIGTYEFPGADAPVVVGGNIVMKQIAITAASTPPANLPRTGGDAGGMWLLLGALLILLGGLALRLRQRA